MLELSMAVLTAAVVITLVPPVQKSIPGLVQIGLWIGFILAAFLNLSNVTSPKAVEATAAMLWASGQLLGAQASWLGGAVAGWVVAHRFTIASYVILALGADVMALALVHTARRAGAFRPKVLLADWYVLPMPARPPVVAPNPLADIDRRLAAATLAGLRSAESRVMASPVAARAAIVAAHFMKPGRKRLRYVKFGLHIHAPDQQVPAGGGPARPTHRHSKTGVSALKPVKERNVSTRIGPRRMAS